MTLLMHPVHASSNLFMSVGSQSPADSMFATEDETKGPPPLRPQPSSRSRPPPPRPREAAVSGQPRDSPPPSTQTRETTPPTVPADWVVIPETTAKVHSDPTQVNIILCLIYSL